MIKVLVAALLGTIIGIIVMVVVIAISGTDTSGASSVGLSVSLSTYTPSTSTASTPTSSGGGSSGGGTSTGGQSTGGDANAGKAVFASAGCAGCHTLSQAGATGTIGPDLNTAIKGDAGSTPLPQFIKESIINPRRGDREGVQRRDHADQLRFEPVVHRHQQPGGADHVRPVAAPPSRRRLVPSAA